MRNACRCRVPSLVGLYIHKQRAVHTFCFGLRTEHSMKTLRDYAPILAALSKAKRPVVAKIIQPAKRDLIDALSEISLNVLYGKVPLTKTQFNQLRKFKRNLRLMSRKGASIRRRKVVLQQGGFISTLLSVVTPLLLSGSLMLKKAITAAKRQHG